MTKSSIDSEIHKFSSIASDWWNQNGKFKVLHNFNKVRVEYIKNILNKENITNDSKILDVGCGGGILSESFAKLNFNVYGIDASYETIEIAKSHAKEQQLDNKITYENILPEDFAKKNPSKKFPIVFAMEILEHVADPKTFLQVIISLLDDSGIIFFSTINRNTKSLILAKFVAEYILNWVPKGTHDHSKFIIPSELNAMLESFSFSIYDIKGIQLNPMDRSWKLNQNPDINYICCAKKNT